MLQIKNIRKEYRTGDARKGDSLVQTALDGISLNLRDNEFVAVLGQSGSGKTTMLNIIGGLDRYDDGDLIINGVSTKKYKDRDWDSYRNHTIGFVFQSYNLIPHQSVLQNVELALTISGISKAERKRRASEALKKVGLGKQLHKKPTQMSGGQMQRVAIARALVNNPDILLADEPTGALDTETSIQVMDLLKEVAADRLVIMVTHNPELAEKYATRTVNLRDGKIISDSEPFLPKESEIKEPEHKNLGKAKMSFFTALSLSTNNLLTKKGRTFLTAFAGSIGIIGIALILSLSSGMQNYIQRLQEDTLSTYPLSIESETIDMGGMMSAMMGKNDVDREGRDDDKIYSNNIIGTMMETLDAQMSKNDLKNFKAYLESSDSKQIIDNSTVIQYGYDIQPLIYTDNDSDNILKVNPTELFSAMSGGMGAGSSMGSMVSTDVWTEMLGNKELLEKQYDVLAGRWATGYNEVVIVVDKNNEINDAVLYSLGILDQEQLNDMLSALMKGEKPETEGISSYTYEDILNKTFKLVINTDIYTKENGVWKDNSEKDSFLKSAVSNALEIKVVGILRPNEDVSAASISSAVAYTSDLTKYIINKVNDSDIVKEQKADPEINVLTGLPFEIKDFTENLTLSDVEEYIRTLPQTEQEQFGGFTAAMSDDEVLAFFSEIMKDDAGKATTYDDNLTKFGVIDLENPNQINIYPLDFEAKDNIKSAIEEYNAKQTADGNEKFIINYTDFIDLMMSSVTNMIDIVTYVLIAFVAISLVVSSIMIAIITYISVMERTKEIGVLRSIGASKKDVSSVFNAETVIEGLVSGVLGVGITMLLNIPINIIIKNLSGISSVSNLPVVGAIALIALSVLLTVVAGLIPSRAAAKKDPVAALRSE